MRAMMYKFWILLRDRRNRICVSSAVLMLLAVALVLLAKAATRFINEAHVPSIEMEMIDDLLSVVASSMLAVYWIARKSGDYVNPGCGR